MSESVAFGDRFGPVELFLFGLPTVSDQAALSALIDFAKTGFVQLLDLIYITKAEDGEITLVEIEELPDGFDIDIASLGATGLVGHDDIAELATAIPAGASAVLVAIELVYQRELAARTADSGSVLLGYERIPASVVDALMASAPRHLEV